MPNPPDSFRIDPDGKILKTVQQVPWSMHISSGSIPDPIYGEPFSYTLQAVAGVPDYTWEKIQGQFPYGLTLNESTGELYGTPGWVGQSFFKVRCTDSDSPPNVDERSYVVTVVEVSSEMRGDCDGSGGIDIDDVVFLINYIFSGGPAPDPVEMGDVNCEAGIDIDDAVYLIAYIFASGPEPCEL
jgi:hypothetical protein